MKTLLSWILSKLFPVYDIDDELDYDDDCDLDPVRVARAIRR
jgi:hypothetical protein